MSGGKSSKVTIGFKYYMGQHLGLVHGPIDGVSRIRVGEKCAWSGWSSGERIFINSPNLFGGEAGEGGIEGDVDIEIGRQDQEENDYLQARFGGAIPAFKGITCAVLRQVYLAAFNPYLKPWAFLATRVRTKTDGSPQWKLDKAQISGPNAEDLAALTALRTVPPPTHQQEGVFPQGYQSEGDVRFVARPEENPNWDHTTVAGNSEGANYSIVLNNYQNNPPPKVTMATGSSGVAPLNQSGFATRCPEGSTCVVFPGDASILGDVDSRTFEGWTRVCINAPPEIDCDGVCADANPAHILRECLTDKEWGMGYSEEEDIDDESFSNVADTLFDEGRGLSLLWQRETTIESFIQDVTRHIDAAIYVSRSTGKFVLKLIRDDYSVGSLITLSPANVERVENFRRPAFGDLVNTVTAVYQECPYDRQASATAQDIALVQMQGGVVAATVEYPGFSNRRNAAWAAQRDLQSLSVPLASCTVYTGPAAEDLDIGDPFMLEWPDYFEGAKVMRVVGMAFGDGRTQRIRIECVEDAFGTPQDGLLAEENESLWQNPTMPPAPAEHQIALEAPYRDLVSTLGEQAANDLLEDNEDVGFLLTTAARPQEGGNAITAQINVDSGGGFQATTNAEFSPFATLSGGVGFTDTTWPVENVQDADEIEIGTWAQCQDELVRVDGISTVDGKVVSITVGRGVLDTVPAEHAEGDGIFFWQEFVGTDEVEYVADEEIAVRLRPRNNSGIVALEDAVTMPVTFSRRAIRPYPPGNVLVNGDPYPEIVSSESLLEVTWSHRDRLQQTGDQLISTEEGNIGPEDGTTYTVTIRDPSDTIIQETTGISGTSWTEDSENPITESAFFIELQSVRNGFESWQSHRVFVSRDPLLAPANLQVIYLEDD